MPVPQPQQPQPQTKLSIMDNKLETAIFAGGCFWCTEAVFKMLKGVITVEPGYAGGITPNPTYEEVSAGLTGHAEVIKIEYDPTVIAFKTLLTVFFASHDPSTLNRQGNDVCYFNTHYLSFLSVLLLLFIIIGANVDMTSSHA